MRPAPNPATPLPEIATAREVAGFLRVCPRQALRLGIPVLRLSPRVVRFARADVLAWLEQRRAPGKAAA